MDGCKKSSSSGHSYNSLYVNPLTELRHTRSCSDYGHLASKGDNFEDFTHRHPKISAHNKENAEPNKENPVSKSGSSSLPKHFSKSKSLSTERILKPNSLQFCMQVNEPERGSRIWDSVCSENSSSLNIWDHSDSEAAPASSWSTLPNKYIYTYSLLLMSLLHYTLNFHFQFKVDSDMLHVYVQVFDL